MQGFRCSLKLIRFKTIQISFLLILLFTQFIAIPAYAQTTSQPTPDKKQVGPAGTSPGREFNFPGIAGVMYGQTLPSADGSLLFRFGGIQRNDSFCSHRLGCFEAIPYIWTVKPTTQEVSVASASCKCYSGMATILKDGRLFIAGGLKSATIDSGIIFTPGLTDSTVIYDPLTNNTEYPSHMSVARYAAGAILLKDGRVLVAGGYVGSPYSINPPVTPTEIFDPATGSWTTTTPAPVGGEVQLYLLEDGKVLLMQNSRVFTFDPVTSVWTEKANLSFYPDRLLKLANGMILAFRRPYGQPVQAAIYNPSNDTWKPFENTCLANLTKEIVSLDPYSVLVSADGYNLQFCNLLTGAASEVDFSSKFSYFTDFIYLGDGKVYLKGILASGDQKNVVYQYPLEENFLVATPGHLQVRKAGNSISLTWQDRPGNGDGYVIDRKLADSTQWQQIGQNTTNIRTFNDTNPPAATKLDYRVRAFNGAGYSLELEVNNLQAGALSVYRFYRLSNGTHFYTMDEKEKNTLLEKFASEMKYEGVVYNGYDFSGEALLPVYRFYNRSTNAHFYTINESEKNGIIANWSSLYSYEGIAFYAQVSTGQNTKAVYRFYNYQTKAHFYTSNESEKNTLIAQWKQLYNYEGIAFHAF